VVAEGLPAALLIVALAIVAPMLIKAAYRSGLRR
jgi:hypothetical protein